MGKSMASDVSWRVQCHGFKKATELKLFHNDECDIRNSSLFCACSNGDYTELTQFVTYASSTTFNV